MKGIYYIRMLSFYEALAFLRFLGLRTFLKLENRYYLCNFPALFQKGAFRHAFLVLFISMLVFLIVKYKISKFSY